MPTISGIEHREREREKQQFIKIKILICIYCKRSLLKFSILYKNSESIELLRK